VDTRREEVRGEVVRQVAALVRALHPLLVDGGHNGARLQPFGGGRAGAVCQTQGARGVAGGAVA